MSDVLLRATGLTKSFPAGRSLLGRPAEIRHAVRGVDVEVARGETLAVVGESGAGKSTVGRLVLRLIEPDKGSVWLDGVDVTALRSRELRAIRKRMQMIFQDPFSSLDPMMVIEDAVAEPLDVHFGIKGPDARKRVLELLDRVGIGEHQAERYPYEFSGGQLQRIAIARALAVEPDIIVCDEPVAALDVSIRAQVVNLLHDLQRERGVAYVFISHDLSLVRLIAHRVAVMYQGRVVEEGDTATLFANPRHPYTRALLDVIPVPDPRRRERRRRSASAGAPAGGPAAAGEAAQGAGPADATAEAAGTERVSAGCAYAPRCPSAMPVCWSDRPELRASDDGTKVSCHLDDPVVAAGRQLEATSADAG